MKKLLIGLLSCSILIGCGKQNLSPSMPFNETGTVQNSSGNQVSIQSTQGMKKFYSLLVAHVFNNVDRSQDHGINYEEFNSFMFTVGNGGFGTIIAVPFPIPSATPMPASASIAAASKDNFQTFLKIDKNKDGKISLAEAQASYLFLGVNEKQLREGLSKFIFKQVDTNKNKAVSKDEFIKYISIFDPSTQPGLMALFITSDKNFDNKLGFSEFEDLIYASVRSGWEQLPAPLPTTGPSSNPCETCDLPGEQP